MANHFIHTVPRLLSSERKQKMWSKKTLLTLLKASNIYGGLLSLITVTTYLLLVFSFPGTFSYLPIQAILLPFGIISVTVFSYLHLSYYGKASDGVVCPMSIGVFISLMCLSPGLIITAQFTIPVLRYGDILALREPLFCIPFILGTIGIVLGAISMFAILRINRIRKLPGELRLKPEMWKTKGWWLSIAILTLGVIIAGASVMSGPEGKTEVAYEVRLDTGTSEEETTFFLPVPIDESIGEVADVMNELNVVDGTADWEIVDTAHGTALEVRTKAKCVLSSEKECGYKGWAEGEEWLYSYNFSMLQRINRTDPEVWVFATTADATLRMRLSLDDGMNNHLRYISVGSTPTDPDTYEVPLNEGWQTVKLARSLLCYD
ncbi:hypothetical protein C5S53_14495 [Methanophagales archaeon]|nr:hypothetical protein C5S53_14495 [Methanophagales archaeon]